VKQHALYREVQQGGKRSSMEELRKKAEEHYEKGIPREA